MFLVDFVSGEAEDFILAPAGVVGEIEDVLPRRLMVPVAAPAARRASWYWRI